MPYSSAFCRAANEVDALLGRRFWRWAVFFVTLLLACSITQDIRAKMWLDEFYTLYVAQQASPGEIVKATIEGADGAPPLYAILVHSILPMVRREALAVRLPSTLGYCGMIVCLMAFCRRRLPAAYSLAASLLAGVACLYYATEGRSYGMVLGCAAGALLCWQMAADGRRRNLSITLLALCLALMAAMHFYAIFFLVPLFCGEMARWRTSRKLDFAILAAMASPLPILGLHYPLIAGNKLQAHFWAHAGLGQIPQFYSSYFALFCPILLMALVVIRILPANQRERQADLKVHEWVVIGTLALMPPMVVAISKYTTHVFVDRYILWVVIGFAVLVGALLCAAGRHQPAVGVILLGMIASLLAGQEIGLLLRQPVLRYGETVLRQLETLPDGPEPIVIPNNHVFMELSYYAGPRLRERLVFPIRRELDLRYLGHDSVALTMSALGRRTKLPITDYDAVLAAYPRFILVASPDWGEYLTWHLVEAGYHVVPIYPEFTPALYEVEAPGRK